LKKLQSDYSKTSNYYPSPVNASKEKEDAGSKEVNGGEKPTEAGALTLSEA